MITHQKSQQRLRKFHTIKIRKNSKLLLLTHYFIVCHFLAQNSNLLFFLYSFISSFFFWKSRNLDTCSEHERSDMCSVWSTDCNHLIKTENRILLLHLINQTYWSSFTPFCVSSARKQKVFGAKPTKWSKHI